MFAQDRSFDFQVHQGTEDFSSNLAYGNSVFVAWGTSGINTSSDGLNWTRSYLSVSGPIVRFLNGKFFALASPYTSQYFVSTDGWNWSAHRFPNSYQIFDITYGNGTYLAAGVALSSINTTWNPSFHSSAISLSNNNLTATTSGTSGQTVRSTYSRGYGFGKLMFEVTVGTVGTSLLIGLCTANFDLSTLLGTNASGLGLSLTTDVANSLEAQSLYLNGVALFSQAALADCSDGDIITVCVDVDNRLIWFTTPVMRANFGSTAWNNDTNADPGTGVGGASYSTLDAWDVFICLNAATGGASATLNTGQAPFSIAVPSGVQAWDSAPPNGAGGHYTAGLLSSSDGLAWSPQGIYDIISQTGSLDRISFLNNQFVLIGSNNFYLATSADGITWTQQLDSNFSAGHCWGIAFGAGTYIGIVDSGSVMTSSDGQTWTYSDVSGFSGYSFNDIIFDGTEFYAVGDSGTLLKTTDGLTWTALGLWHFVGGQTLWGVNTDGSKLVIVGRSGVSATSDGSLITVAHATNGYVAGCQNGSTTVAISTGLDNRYGIGISQDEGITWTGPYNLQPSSSNWFSHIIFANNLYVLCGSSGLIQTSTDGISWTTQTSVTANNLNTLRYLNSTYIATGDKGTIITSPDAVTWTAQTTPPDVASSLISDIAYGNSIYVAVAARGSNFTGAGPIITSPDLVNWTYQFTVSGGPNLVGVVFDGTNFVIAGGTISGSSTAVILTSTDGITWTAQDSSKLGQGPSRASSMCLKDGKIYVGGWYCLASSSDHGVSWSAASTGYRPFFVVRTMLVTQNGVLAQCGGNLDSGNTGNGFLYSTDGVTWTARNVNNLTCLGYDGTTFAAFGSGGLLQTSTDAASWSPPKFIGGDTINDMVLANGRYVAVGVNGTILVRLNPF